MSDKEIDNLNIPLKNYENSEKFKDFKNILVTKFGANAYSYIKYGLILYTLIDLYSLTSDDKKNMIVKYLEKMGIKQNNISKIDNLLRMGLSAGYITLYLCKKKEQKEEVKKDNV